uniref:Uncharacterized protein n=1 Tax=Lepeophtheirus salmonis TaxID=72036 RepID=A0A0K2TCV7_LEPSM
MCMYNKGTVILCFLVIGLLCKIYHVHFQNMLRFELNTKVLLSYTNIIFFLNVSL